MAGLRSGCIGGLLLLALVLPLGSAARAADVQLKNGLVLQGNLRLMEAMSRTSSSRVERIKKELPMVVSIIQVDKGFKRYYVPRGQVTEKGFDLNKPPAPQEVFAIPQIRTGREFTVTSAGTLLNVDPWSEFGRRRVTLATQRGPVAIIQGLTEIGSESAKITSLTHGWEYGVAISQIPPDVCLDLLRKNTDKNSSQDRLAIARFCVLADLFPQAFAELESIGSQFPELQDRVASARADLLQAFGQTVLLELRRRREAGQHQLAEEYARRLPAFQLGAAVTRDVEQFLARYADERVSIEQAKLQLGDLQAALTERFDREQLAALRSEVSSRLNFEALPRLDPFLKSLSDPQLPADEKLALAYSGYLLGSSQATTSLDQTLRLWSARQMVLDWLRTSDVNEQKRLLTALTELEGIGPQYVLQLVRQLPPPAHSDAITPDVTHTIDVPERGREPATSYQVLLPPEYDPEHRYPALVVLSPAERSDQGMVEFWGGTAEAPGWTRRRGYILLVPQYAEPTDAQYTYATSGHERVLAALRDARERFSIDADRVFLTGHGRGGDATFDIGLSHPQEFAGLIPFCGRIDHYARHYLENGTSLGWYIVAGEIDRDLSTHNSPYLDKLFVRGVRFDLIYAEYLQRGLEGYPDELEAIFDWMEGHRRGAPPTEFEVTSLRRTDRMFHWIECHDLPRHVILPAPPGARQSLHPMNIEGRITSPSVIQVRSPAQRHTLWLTPEMIDVNERLKIRTAGGQAFNDFVSPQIEAILVDQSRRADRQRPYSVRIDF